MKKLNYLLSFLFVFGLIFASQSCNESNDLNTEEEKEFVNPQENVGMEHNLSLDYVMENLKSVPTSSELIKKEVSSLLSAYYDKNEKTKSVSVEDVINQIPDFPESLTELDIENWVSKIPYSDLLKTKILETLEILKDFSSIEDLNIKLKSKEELATNFFKDEELRVYYEHLAVARYSVLYWSNNSNGGEGGFAKSFRISLELTGKHRTKAVDYWKVFAVDCIGGVMGGPLGYAGGSAIATIMQM